MPVAKPLYETIEFSIGSLQLTISYMGVTNRALAHNRIPIVHEVVGHNTADPDSAGSSPAVHVHVSGSVEDTQLFDGSVDIPKLKPGKGSVASFHEATRVDTRHVLGADESRPGQIVFTVTIDDAAQPIVERRDLRVLASNEWFNAPPYYESLTAFIQPNVPEVMQILSRASMILATRTGSPSIEGYQNGPLRAVEIASAIYEALHDWGIRYLNPPASFENSGQRVRTTREVLQARFGTCIDLSITFAAVAEQAGLNPVIILVPGHALTGILLTENPLPEPVIVDAPTILNYLRSGAVLPIDARYFSDHPDDAFGPCVDFTRRSYLDAQVEGLIGVTASRRDGMRPLPSGVDERELLIAPPMDTSPLSSGRPMPTMDFLGHLPDDSDTFLERRDDSPTRVSAWRRELLDLTLRNRLLNMRPGPEVLSLYLPTGSLAELDNQIHAGQRIALRPMDDVSQLRVIQGLGSAVDLPPEQVAETLSREHSCFVDVGTRGYPGYFKRLTRTVRTLTEDTGSSNLYLSLGAMVHDSTSGRRSVAPLFLVPVKLTGGRGRARFRIQVDSTHEASPNYCLVEWLRTQHGVEIPALSRPKLDESGIDIPHALTEIAKALIDANLPFTVVEEARLVIARFSTYGMWRDLRDHWSQFMASPVFRHLVEHPGETFNDPDADVRSVEVDEAALALPIPADGTQLKAVAAASRGYSFVLEGPPGTGKSQTITNMIAHLLDQGKTVLFVAEKQAALEVVKRRLAKIGLDDFTLDLHGADQQPTAIRDQLKRAIDAEVFYDMGAWDSAVAEYRARLAPLIEYPNAIHETNAAGFSLWSANATVMRMGDGPSAPIPVAFVSRPAMSIDELRRASYSLAMSARVTGIAAMRRWALVGCSPISGLEEAWGTLANAHRLVAARPNLARLLGGVPGAQLLETVEALHHIEALSAQHRTTDLDAMSSTPAALRALADRWKRIAPSLEPVTRVFSALFIVNGDLVPLREAALDADRGFFGRKKRQERYEQLLRPALAPGAPAQSTEQIVTLLDQIPMIRATSDSLSTELAALHGCEDLAKHSILDPSLGTALLDRAATIEQMVDLRERFPAAWASSETGLATDASTIADAWIGWLRTLGCTNTSMTRWLAGREWFEAWQHSHDDWAADVDAHGSRNAEECARWHEACQPFHAAGLDSVVDAIETGRLDPNDLETAIQRGLAEASLAERGTRDEINGFCVERKEGELDLLNRAIRRVQEEAPRALAARLLSRRPYSHLEGRYAQLRRQLDAKRNAKSLRTLLREFGTEICTVAPCFFVSPASAATFIEPDSVLFDVVIFDEASQITVDQAMGCIGRGRSAIISGDSKQMPPTRVGKTIIDSDDLDDEEDYVEDLESILSECVESGLPQLWLSWHYRSQDESLIAFSNAHYYAGQLASLPSPGGNHDAGVSVHRVDGHFDRSKGDGHRTNAVEAHAIVDRITQRINDPALTDQSIGVVTFNIQQRDLILDLLEESKDPLVRAAYERSEEPIFVKNLENVQGDERDVILFSTAFSRRDDDGPLPLNFGPLTRKGGERRLNVAITRARRAVEMYTSFDPDDIDLNRTSSLGLAHLKEYMTEAIARQRGPERRERTGLNVDVVRDAIADRLRERGWIVDTDFGLSSYTLDLVVRPESDPRWHVAIITDGERWASLPTVADRDLTPRLLTALMGWPAVVRVWLPEYLDDPDAVIDRIERQLEAARAEFAQRDEAYRLSIERRSAALENEKSHVLTQSDDDDDNSERVQWTTEETPGPESDADIVDMSARSAPASLDRG